MNRITGFDTAYYAALIKKEATMHNMKNMMRAESEKRFKNKPRLFHR